MTIGWLTDCRSLYDHLLQPGMSEVTDKRLAIDLTALRQDVWRDLKEEVLGNPTYADAPPSAGTNKVAWVDAATMAADGLTKRMKCDQLELLMRSGFSCWLLSGYGAASLPLWYFGFSATVAYKLVRCCHDEHVSPGVPHCFRPVDQDLAQVVEQAWVSSSAFALKTVDHWRSFGQEVLFASSGQKKKKEKKKKEKGS
eukprot:g16375.t1